MHFLVCVLCLLMLTACVKSSSDDYDSLFEDSTCQVNDDQLFDEQRDPVEIYEVSKRSSNQNQLNNLCVCEQKNDVDFNAIVKEMRRGSKEELTQRIDQPISLARDVNTNTPQEPRLNDQSSKKRPDVVFNKKNAKIIKENGASKVSPVSGVRRANRWIADLSKDTDKTSRTKKIRKLKSSVLAIREAPNLRARIVGYIHSGQDVEVYEDGWDGWTKIGDKKFVRTKYLLQDLASIFGKGPYIYLVKPSAIYVREKPSQKADIVGVLIKGEKIRGKAASNGWVEIETNRFVRDGYVEILGH